ncbi:hypothetical protein HELRODRAFT_187961 [Helobdella robusta]|uniref:RNA polymerase I-specific transcription initiation factor RRN3 n=1 Tax=Helobdella robusta TaxID=6412 RepID=T1FPI3_HELRO|nr:hypothetical protein HELRODRAFT_187961 [Helobdella robusta]ESO12706.1 hypothetical protein HELRODRAFT_187961 [Helobdella robusta]
MMEIENFQTIVADLEKGLTRSYDVLVSVLRLHNNPESTDKLEERFLLNLLNQVHFNVVQLNRRYSALVFELLKLDWLSLSNEFHVKYTSFALDLISAHTAFYMHEFMKTIIQNFKPKPKYEQMALQGNLSDEEINRENLMFEKNHELLEMVFQIVPSALMVLPSLVPYSFPHYRLASNHCQVCFVRNMFRMMKYTPTMKVLILQWIFKHIIQFDAEASRQEILASEDDDDDEEVEEIEDGVFPVPVKSSEPKMKLVVADIMDCLMLVVYQYIMDSCYVNGTLNWEETKKLYLDLLKCFDSLLLTTFKTCHIQFVLFYICSFKSEIAENFAEFLWKKVISPNNEVMYRQLSASYLGSFLSRASYISVETVKQQLLTMVEWIHRYIDNCTDNTNKPDVHRPFYSVCQSFFYIIVFTHKNIIDTPKGQKFCMSLHLQKISSCRLNPLKFCLLSVAETFCAVVRNNQIAFCDTVLEKNRRLKMSEMSKNSDGGCSSSVGTSSNFLLSYFPFDPYLLVRSGELVKPLYKEYDNSLLNECTVNEDVISEEMDYLEIDQLPPSTTVATTLATSPARLIPTSPRRTNNFAFSPKLTDYFIYCTSPGFTHQTSSN